MNNQQLNILTIDLEEWFHINDSDWIPPSSWTRLEPRVIQNTLSLLDLLAKHHQKATFFTLGWIAEYYPDLIREILVQGHELGYHSYYHLRPFRQTRAEFEQDLEKGLSLISSISGKSVNIYRAPNLSLNSESLWILPILVKHGITISSSIRAFRRLSNVQASSRPFKWLTTNGSLVEFPLNRSPFFGYPLTYTGSGYFRVIPYAVARRLFIRSDYNMAYFHPNDIDDQHPTAKEIGLIRNFMNVVGTSGAFRKIGHLLSDFKFVTISVASDVIQMNEMPEIMIEDNFSI